MNSETIGISDSITLTLSQGYLPFAETNYDHPEEDGYDSSKSKFDLPVWLTDSMSALQVAQNPIPTKRTKHY